MNNWIDNLQTYTTALEQQIEQLSRRLDAAEREIAELHDKLNDYAENVAKEPEIEVELLVPDEEQSLSDVLPTTQMQAQGSKECETPHPPTQPIVALSDKEASAQEETQRSSTDEAQVEECPVPTQEKEMRHEEPTIERGTTLAPPVSDIRKAISLGDRFLFQRELFATDGEKMNKTIDTLNKMQSLEEALEYVHKHFNWSEDNPATQLFISVLHRRFA